MLKKLSQALNWHIAYTLLDINYANDLIHNVFAITHNVIGFLNRFFMLAIDDATVALGWQYGYLLAWGGGGL